MIYDNRPIGIFDSGLGGLSVLNDCLTQLPNEHFIYYGDSAFAPYGIKTNAEILERCITICDFFLEKNVKAIVIACNTATSAAADALRERYSIPIIGMEPALKPATSHEREQRIIVMATELTLREQKFDQLLQTYGKKHTIIKMPCPDFVKIVESDITDPQVLVNEQLDKYKDQFQLEHIDSIVLGCTHFIFLKKYIRQYFGEGPAFIDGNLGTVTHLARILNDSNQFASGEGSYEIYNSSDDVLYKILADKLIKIE